jgi:hypothetical protein
MIDLKPRPANSKLPGKSGFSASLTENYYFEKQFFVGSFSGKIPPCV